jgi:cysteinyl-tRNA synthetase
VLDQAEKGLDRLRSALQPAAESAGGASTETLERLANQVQETKTGYIAAMDDDFNSAAALAHLFELVRVINFSRNDGATNAELEPAQQMLRELTAVFGLKLEDQTADTKLAAADPFIQLLIDLRLELRQQKNWALADKIRDQLSALGVLLEDSKDGTRWHWA